MVVVVVRGGVGGQFDQLGLGDVCCSDLPWFKTLGTSRSSKGDFQENVAEK